MPETTKQGLDPESTTWQTAAGELGALWCTFMHDSPMWPIHGEYRCRTCGRRYPVPWARDKFVPAPPTLTVVGPTRIRQANVPSFRSASLPLFFVLAAMLVSTLRAADAPIVESNTPASMAFARYVAGLEQAGPWSLETVEIDASLPKFERRGRLRGETGAAVRQSGYLVTQPSIFVKRVDIARETTLRDGIAAMRVTHLSVDTRLVGRAQLTIQERPYTAPDHGPALSIAEQ